MSSTAETLVVVPIHNEEQNIARVIQEIKAKASDCDILVVNDASTDDGPRISKEMGIPVLDLPINLGIGGAVQTGFMLARSRDYEIVVQVDGDGQHDPSFIPDLIAPIKAGQADISIGSRRLYSNNPSPSVTRLMGMRFFSWMTSALTSATISDCTSGFRALNRRAFTLFSNHYPTDFPDAEALIAAHRAGLKICEIPARFRERDHGKSSLRPGRLFYYPFKESFSILMMLTTKRGVSR
jgi:glycosyltransferase involved in cell wall biosynthesis